MPRSSAGQASTDDAHQEPHREDTTMLNILRQFGFRDWFEIIGIVLLTGVSIASFLHLLMHYH
jgi:hypothetical protein